MEKKIYIVVAVYNVEKYLQECINSIIAQTYKNWEAILVDDGSTDSSGKICDENAAKEPRIRVVHQKNKGLFGARMTGVENITDIDDTYCIFCDSDDAMPDNALQLLCEALEENSCDIVYGKLKKFSNRRSYGESDSSDPIDLKIYEGREIFDVIYKSCFGYGDFSVNLVSKLYKTQIVKAAFAEIKTWPRFFGEDLNGTLRILPLAKKVATLDNVVYFYRYGGGTNKFMNSYFDDCVLMYNTKKEYAAKHNMSQYTRSMIEVEMKNLAMNYFVMCIRSKTYPHGKLKDEVEFLLDTPEFQCAVSSISDDILQGDHTEMPGFTEALRKRDIATLEKLSKKKANEHRLMRFIKSKV